MTLRRRVVRKEPAHIPVMRSEDVSKKIDLAPLKELLQDMDETNVNMYPLKPLIFFRWKDKLRDFIRANE